MNEFSFTPTKRVHNEGKKGTQMEIITDRWKIRKTYSKTGRDRYQDRYIYTYIDRQTDR
jgi:hypothetical protein